MSVVALVIAGAGRSDGSIARADARPALELASASPPPGLLDPSSVLASPFGLPATTDAALQRAGATLAHIPMVFERAARRDRGGVRFVARGEHYSVQIAPGAVNVRLATPGSRQAGAGRGALASLILRFVGAHRHPQITAERRSAAVANYLVGSDPSRWRTGVPTFERVRYRALWPGIDAVFYGNERQVEYDFVVAPGADPGTIELALGGLRDARIDRRGDLLLDVGGEIVRQRAPVAYQLAAGQRAAVASQYVLRPGGRVGLRVGAYDRERSLVIDPVIAYTATAVDGNGADKAHGVAVDASGAAYVTGFTSSTNLGAPSSVQPTYGGGQNDAFVAKLNPAGTALEYITYLGGDQNDVANDIAVDAAGNAYVAGNTQSADFPTTPGAIQTSSGGGGTVAFVTKLNSAGSALSYSTYLGGAGGASEVANGIALDTAGNAYIGGVAGPGFPQATGAPVGGDEGIVAKLNPAGTAIVYATYLPGTGTVFDIAVNAAREAFMTGTAHESGLATAGAFQTTYASNGDAFALKLNAAGSARLYATYLGGNDSDLGAAIAVDASGAAYVVGSTTSTNFPLAQPIQSEPGEVGWPDAFVTKLTPAGDALAYSTYLSGVQSDHAEGVAVLPSGAAMVAGRASTGVPVVNTFGGGFSAFGNSFVAQFAPDGASLIYSSPSNVAAPATDVALDSRGFAYVVGGDGYVTLTKYPSDIQAPETTIVSGPPSTSTSNTATFTFSTTEPGAAARFECQLGGAAFSACESPKTYSVLADGTRTFRVRAIDEAGNVDDSPASYTWTVAADPPNTLITGTPPPVTNATASIAFTSTRPGSTFECRLDTGTFAPCVSPITYSDLSGGSHTFAVRATDTAGETDVSPAQITWTVDLTAPQTSITASPLQLSAESNAMFAFSADDPAATFECRLDDTAFAACTSPRTYTTLGDGPHSFAVRATDAVGNVDQTPSQYTWTIETASPDTTITDAPPAASKSPTASFSFSASEPATFACKLDTGEFSACTSPKSLAGLAEGEHTFAVRALDAAAKPDPSPAAHTWIVDLTAPAPFTPSQPAAGALHQSPSVAFAWPTTTDALTAVQRYELWIDGTLQRTLAAAECLGGCLTMAPAPLGNGAHTWQVRAYDTAGNDRATTLRDLDVDAAAPAAFDLADPADADAVATRHPTLSWQAASDAGAEVAQLPAGVTSYVPAAELAEGTHAWQVIARDANANTRASTQRTFTIDVTAPTAAFTAAPNPALVGRTVTFDAAASSDAGSGVARLQWDLDGDGAFEHETAPGASPTQIYSEPGTYAVQLRVTDRAGLSATARIDQRITTVGPPGQHGITINAGARYTRSPHVTITATWPSFASQMLISNDGGFGLPRVLPLAKQTAWVLDSSGAERSSRLVYVRFQRGLTTSETYIDDIILDERAPTLTTARVSLVGKTGLLVRLKARDRGLAGVSGVQVTNNRRSPQAAFRAYRAAVRVTRRKGERKLNVRRPVYVRVRDRAGNLSSWRVAKRASTRGR